MLSELLREVSTFKDTEDATSMTVLLWAQRMGLQMEQKVELNNIKKAKECDSVRHSEPKHDNETLKNRREWIIATTVGQGTC